MHIQRRPPTSSWHPGCGSALEWGICLKLRPKEGIDIPLCPGLANYGPQAESACCPFYKESSIGTQSHSFTYILSEAVFTLQQPSGMAVMKSAWTFYKKSLLTPLPTSGPGQRGFRESPVRSGSSWSWLPRDGWGLARSLPGDPDQTQPRESLRIQSNKMF